VCVGHRSRISGRRKGSPGAACHQRSAEMDRHGRSPKADRHRRSPEAVETPQVLTRTFRGHGRGASPVGQGGSVRAGRSGARGRRCFPCSSCSYSSCHPARVHPLSSGRRWKRRNSAPVCPCNPSHVRAALPPPETDRRPRGFGEVLVTTWPVSNASAGGWWSPVPGVAKPQPALNRRSPPQTPPPAAGGPPPAPRPYSALHHRLDLGEPPQGKVVELSPFLMTEKEIRRDVLEEEEGSPFKLTS